MPLALHSKDLATVTVHCSKYRVSIMNATVSSTCTRRRHEGLIRESARGFHNPVAEITVHARIRCTRGMRKVVRVNLLSWMQRKQIEFYARTGLHRSGFNLSGDRGDCRRRREIRLFLNLPAFIEEMKEYDV